MDLAGGGVNAATRGEHNGEASRGERGIHYLDPETGHRDLLAAADAVRPIDEMFVEATQRQSRPELV